jgi:hypothetical protein
MMPKRTELLLTLAIVATLAVAAWIAWGVYHECREAGNSVSYCLWILG